MTNDNDNDNDKQAKTNGSMRSKFVAVNVADLPEGCVGRSIFWVPNGAVPYLPVAEALTAAGFHDDEESLVPSRPSPMVALRRAMDSVSQSHSAHGEPAYYVRPLSAGGKGKKNKSGWLIAQQRDDADVVAGTSAATVDLVCHTEFYEEAGEKRIRFTFDPEEHPYRADIEAKYEFYLTHLVGDDISYFLTQCVARSKLFGMVPVRPSGGFYYVAPEVVAVWSLFTETFAPVSGVSFHHIDVLNTSKSFIEAALAGVTATLGKRIDALGTELEKEPGMRKLSNATDEVAELLSVAAGHEAILGGALTDLRDRAARLGASLRTMIATQEANRMSVDAATA